MSAMDEILREVNLERLLYSPTLLNSNGFSKFGVELTCSIASVKFQIRMNPSDEMEVR
mgnify:CR=1 FL=1